ncbi:MAG: ABC transporter ATP-binding protein [Actinomycetota bacterium]|nr:ABC transporter ATP-binding protein [Actinomycetota bacterium]
MSATTDDRPLGSGRSTPGDELPPDPPAARALWTTIRIGYRAEPKLLLASLAMTVLTALPDALVALWLMFLADGVVDGDRTMIGVAAAGLALSATGTWYLRVLLDRVQRRFRDRVGVELEAHVARLQASIATVEHHERPEVLDRLAVLRDQVFTLDHMFLSLFSVGGWVVRLVITVVLLASIHPALVLLVVLAVPTVVTATWRPGIERAVEESVAPRRRLARHLFELGTTASPGKEVRVTGNGDDLVVRRGEAWDAWHAPIAAARWRSAGWHVLSWAVFGLGYVGAIVFVASGLDESAGAVLLVLAAGSRLSQYVAAAVGELGFLRGVWLDGSRRLAWLEDLAARAAPHGDHEPPDRLVDGVRFERVSFRYPGTERLVLDDVDLHLPAGSVVAVVGENGAGKTTLVKLLGRMYAPTAGRILADGVDIASMPVDRWRSRLAGAFQDFFRFELVARATVGLGDEPHLDDRPAVERAVDRAGAGDVVDHLADGLDTQLGPTWDGGVEVSFGQWQKLALSRGFMRPDPLVLVLDEPTAALDAETEHALFERYASAASDDAEGTGRVTVLVSHRFSTVRMADLIVVVDGARVIEVGTHDELMARDGHYAELYGIQAAAFR